MNKIFWRDKVVLITGFEGFLGSNLTKTLLSSGAKIYGLDIRVRRKETILAADDYKKMQVIKGSVSDYTLVKKTIRRNKINIIFHLAAEALVGRCQSDPLRTFSANIQGTWNILEACRGLKDVQAVIIASSDKAYGSHKKLPYTEEAPLEGRHPYDVSKSCADLLAHTYAYTYGLPAAITRCGNIYGPGDFNFSRLVPDAMRCLYYGRELLIRSDGKFVRDYVYIEDIVNGYIVLAEQLKKKGLGGEAFNLSSANHITVLRLLKKVIQLNSGIKKLKYKILDKVKYEIKEQYLSSAKARRILGWRPQYNLSEGLKKTSRWYFNYFSKR